MPIETWCGGASPRRAPSRKAECAIPQRPTYFISLYGTSRPPSWLASNKPPLRPTISSYLGQASGRKVDTCQAILSHHVDKPLLTHGQWHSLHGDLRAADLDRFHFSDRTSELRTHRSRALSDRSCSGNTYCIHLNKPYIIVETLMLGHHTIAYINWFKCERRIRST